MSSPDRHAAILPRVALRRSIPAHLSAWAGPRPTIFECAGDISTLLASCTGAPGRYGNYADARISAGGGATERYGRVAPQTSTPAQLTAYSGDYHSDELDITYTIALEDGQLVSRTLWGAQPVRLRQVMMDHFDTDSYQPHAIDFQRAAGGRIDAMLIHSSRTSNVRLRRLGTVAS